MKAAMSFPSGMRVGTGLAAPRAARPAYESSSAGVPSNTMTCSRVFTSRPFTRFWMAALATKQTLAPLSERMCFQSLSSWFSYIAT